MRSQGNLQSKRKSVREQLIDGLAIVLSFVHLALFAIGALMFQMSFDPNAGMAILARNSSYSRF